MSLHLPSRTRNAAPFSLSLSRQVLPKEASQCCQCSRDTPDCVLEPEDHVRARPELGLPVSDGVLPVPVATELLHCATGACMGLRAERP